ncbi:MAG: spermidine/putrescine ABC transporter substrate-binding protein [Oscillospiraceae bacterium]|jgi:spermidine/putrescine transport system substrate-binding protein|nr:spermidine/putrescine ABC transporter substrate-binding protein [Oscillospiraceae bacterium]
MKKLFALMLALALVVGALPALAAEEVNVYNWQDYINEDVLDLFEEETGIRVNYMGFTTNEDMLTMVSADPTNYDVIFPSDYIIERMLTMDLLEPLNFENIPNAAYTLEWLKTPDYDPEMKYSVPYMWGTVGVLYNQTMVKEPITSWTALWDTDYRQDVFMLDSYRDSIGVTLKMLGYSMNERDRTALEAARDKLIEQKKAGIVKAYQVDETKDKMIAGEAAMGVMWSGDAAYSMEYNEDLVYVVPDEGSNVWVDGMCIPKGAKNKTNAEIFINFLCRPDIALMNFEEIWYCTPNQAVVDGLDEETLADPTLFPSEEVIARSEFFHDVGEDVTLYDELWSDVKTAR